MSADGAKELETARAVVYPWLCDSMGHLATRNYMQIFDDATYHLLARLGYSFSEALGAQRGWADVSHSIQYRREVRAGDLLVAWSGVLRLGRTSITYTTRLARVGSPEENCAVLTGVAVHFDLTRRQAIELPGGLRDAAAALM